MLRSAVLLLGLSIGPVAEKVDFTPNQTTGTSVSYALSLNIEGDETIAASTTLKWTYCDKSDKGVKTAVKVEKQSLVVNGSEIGEQLNDSEFFLDASGMPDDFSMNGPQAMLVIAHVCTYLPAKKLEQGESFDVDWKRDAATLKGTGRFEAMEEVDGKDLAKLAMSLTLTPHGAENGIGKLEYTAYFDPATGHVQSAKGNGSVDDHEFKFSAQLAPVK
jgi:hypothetical protein